MKVKIPRSWFRLPPREKEAIRAMLQEEYTKQLNEEVNKLVDREEAEMQKVWLKLGCIAGNLAHGHGEMRCLSWLGTWKRLYKTVSGFKTKEEQDAWIDEHIAKIFKGGYPDEFVEKL